MLLDEIDLHLHPTWQRRVIPVLKHVFSNLQFIVTTHSPLVLAGFEKEEIFQLKLDEDGLVVQDPAGIEPGALTASELLTNFFEVPRAGRPELVRMERLRRFNTARDAGNAAALAEILLEAALHTQPDAPFSLLAKVAFREAGLQPA